MDATYPFLRWTWEGMWIWWPNPLFTNKYTPLFIFHEFLSFIHPSEFEGCFLLCCWPSPRSSSELACVIKPLWIELHHRWRAWFVLELPFFHWLITRCGRSCWSTSKHCIWEFLSWKTSNGRSSLIAYWFWSLMMCRLLSFGKWLNRSPHHKCRLCSASSRQVAEYDSSNHPSPSSHTSRPFVVSRPLSRNFAFISRKYLDCPLQRLAYSSTSFSLLSLPSVSFQFERAFRSFPSLIQGEYVEIASLRNFRGVKA